MHTLRVTSPVPGAVAPPTVVGLPAARPEASPVVEDRVSVSAPPSEPEAPEAAAPAPAAPAVQAPASPAVPEPPSTLLMEEPARFEEVPGVPGMAVATVARADTTTAHPS